MTPARRRGSGEGSIYQRADGRWVAVVSLGREGGVRQRRYVYGDTRDEVRQQLTKLVRQRDQGESIARNRETVAEMLERWYADRAPGWRPRTASTIRQRLDQHIVPALGDVMVGELAPHHVQGAVRLWQRTLAPSTCGAVLKLLRQALGRAVRWGELARNVATLVEMPRVEHGEATALTPDQARRLLAAVADDRSSALYVVGVSLGLRVSEAIGLCWSDIDWEQGLVRLRYQLGATADGPGRVPLKTPASRRDIPLPALCLTALRNQRSRQQRERRESGLPDTLFIFTDERTGRPYNRSSVSNRLGRLLKRLGLPHMGYHGLRHSAASLLLAQGVHPKVVMQILGHTNLKQTLGVYSHVSPEVMRDAADAMDALLNSRERG